MNLIPKRTIISMLIVWICIALCLLLVDYFFLRSFSPNGDGYADCRLIPPSVASASQIKPGMSQKKVIDILGLPNTYDPLAASNYFAWDLQFGCRLWASFSGSDVVSVRITIPFVTARWLIYPGILLIVGLIETAVYLCMRKSFKE